MACASDSQRHQPVLTLTYGLPTINQCASPRLAQHEHMLLPPLETPETSSPSMPMEFLQLLNGNHQ